MWAIALTDKLRGSEKRNQITTVKKEGFGVKDISRFQEA